MINSALTTLSASCFPLPPSVGLVRCLHSFAACLPAIHRAPSNLVASRAPPGIFLSPTVTSGHRAKSNRDNETDVRAPLQISPPPFLPTHFATCSQYNSRNFAKFTSYVIVTSNFVAQLLTRWSVDLLYYHKS